VSEFDSVADGVLAPSLNPDHQSPPTHTHTHTAFHLPLEQ